MCEASQRPLVRCSFLAEPVHEVCPCTYAELGANTPVQMITCAAVIGAPPQLLRPNAKTVSVHRQGLLLPEVGAEEARATAYV